MMIPILLLSCGLGFLFSIINVIMRDLEKAIPIGLTLLLFITPIAYELPESGLLATLAIYNPLFYLCVDSRNIIITGNLNYPLGFFCSCILSIFVFLFCWMAFHLGKDRIPERL